MSFTIIETCIGCANCTHKCPVNAISGERKQKHHIDPTLCIDCGTCGKVCPSSAIVDGEGRLTKRIKLSQWLKPVWNYQACVECRICVLACPTGSISLARYQNKPDGIKPSHPFLQTGETCIGCGFCEESCPTSAIILKSHLPNKKEAPVTA